MSMCLPRLHSNQQAALAWRNTAWAVRVGNASEQRMGDSEMVSVKDSSRISCCQNRRVVYSNLHFEPKCSTSCEGRVGRTLETRYSSIEQAGTAGNMGRAAERKAVLGKLKGAECD